MTLQKNWRVQVNQPSSSKKRYSSEYASFKGKQKRIIVSKNAGNIKIELNIQLGNRIDETGEIETK